MHQVGSTYKITGMSLLRLEPQGILSRGLSECNSHVKVLDSDIWKELSTVIDFELSHHCEY